ncbi:hypothetical protein [Streptomyces sp. V3I8]|uniref:hypothetical protein n=1 Tax=Streptomyces sp. V3I8 TaxID=3042279 RepID=UPI0027D85065|nr:hypothetical protein [Streptomyces sp. V3I8]
MPTPYGSRGGLAFGAEELRVLRRALALALHPSPASAQDVQDCLRLAETVDEAAREGARLRAFLLADLARYRAALPGTAAGFLTLLEEAVRAGYHPVPDDLDALRALRGNPVAAALLDRCRTPAEQDVRRRPAHRPVSVPRTRARTRLTALPGGLAAAAPPARAARWAGVATATTGDPGGKPVEEPAADPASSPGPRSPNRNRPVPTPGEVFPRRRPATPPANPSQRLAAV